MANKQTNSTSSDSSKIISREAFFSKWLAQGRIFLLRFLRFIYRHLHPAPTDPAPSTGTTVVFSLGILAFVLCQLLVVSGVLLMFYFVTPVIGAYEGIQDVRTVDFTGAFLRNLHSWSAYGLVITLLLYMGGLAYIRASKLGRLVGWILVTSVVACFSGYLIPWDQLSNFALTAGTNLAKMIPFIGPQVQFLLIGGYSVGQMQLLTFYAIHLIILPLLLGGLLARHFWRIRKSGEL